MYILHISRKTIAIFFKINSEVDDDFVKNNFHTDSRLQKENNGQSIKAIL